MPLWDERLMNIEVAGCRDREIFSDMDQCREEKGVSVLLDLHRQRSSLPFLNYELGFSGVCQAGGA